MVSRLALALAAAACLTPGARATAAPAGRCEPLLASAVRPMPQRPMEPEDLVRLRDIGPADPGALGARLFTASPDGSRLAFQLRQAEPSGNLYCLAMVVIDARPGGTPLVVDRGGELIRKSYDFRGKAGYPTGIAEAITPRWSPDGSWIAFLKREGGTTQVWRAWTDGGGSAPITRSDVDVEDFRVSPDGTTILYVTRPGLRAARAAIAREGRSGFHYDDRYAAMASTRPFPPAPVARVAHALDLRTGTVRNASPSEAAELGTETSASADWPWARSVDGRLALPADASGDAGLRLQTAGREDLACPAPECADATRPWWTTDGRRLRFLRREGWARGSTAIYEWNPAGAAVRRLYVTEDLLAHCEPSGEALICLRESSLKPRRLEHLDPATGERQLLFDPNPQFAQFTLGRVERLRWRNAFGLETIGDLVLPVGYRPGTRYPLVVVQYDTRGFLRGGTGDEYPIQAFANRGYAVLSVSRPRHVGLFGGAEDVVGIERINLAGFADRRSTLSSVEMGVQQLVERGIADPGRIGITGLSDGASTVAFALLHSNLFAAVAMSSCCIDTTLPMRVGPAAARLFHDVGYPRIIDRADAFWSELSLSRNAPRISTPILLQVADSELMSALESYTALREANAPVDLFVFPEEHHIKWQPAHRLAIYERALDWFDYWLRGIRSTDPIRQPELRHWDVLARARPVAADR